PLLYLSRRAADLRKAVRAREAGRGTGSLPPRLPDTAGAVLSVEIDPAFADLTKETLGDRPNVVLLHHDILRNKNELRPDVLTSLEELRQKSGCTSLKLGSNLPYAVATPVISHCLLSVLAL